MNDPWNMDKALTDEQVEKVIQAWINGLDNTIDGFGHNVDTQSLLILRKVLIKKLEKIDAVLTLLGYKNDG